MVPSFIDERNTNRSATIKPSENADGQLGWLLHAHREKNGIIPPRWFYQSTFNCGNSPSSRYCRLPIHLSILRCFNHFFLFEILASSLFYFQPYPRNMMIVSPMTFPDFSGRWLNHHRCIVCLFCFQQYICHF